MRFAGDAIRNKGRTGKARAQRSQAQSGSISDYKYRYSAPGLPASRAEMPEEDISRYTKLGEPEFRIPDFVIPEFKKYTTWYAFS